VELKVTNRLFENLLIRERDFLVLVILTGNALVWFYMTYIQLGSILANFNATFDQVITAWLMYYSAIIFSLLFGSVALTKIRMSKIMIGWIFLGCVSTVLPVLLKITAFEEILIYCSFIGFSFGIGLPYVLAYFAELTTLEKRGRVAGLLLLLLYLCVIAMIILIQNADFTIQTILFTVWRGSGIIFLLFDQLKEKENSKETLPFSFILTNKPFLLYFTPWLLFNIANQALSGFLEVFLKEQLFTHMQLMTIIVATVFTFVGGLLLDLLGRKKVIICGFTTLGLACAILSMIPISSPYFILYPIADGAAWGTFMASFVFTIWGDLFTGKRVERVYAIGIFPPYLAGVVWYIFAPILTEIPSYGAFSLGALFLFIAVIPLMFAPETLAKEIVELRKMRKYVKDGKRLREWYS
jgi:MFS family permease